MITLKLYQISQTRRMLLKSFKDLTYCYCHKKTINETETEKLIWLSSTYRILAAIDSSLLIWNFLHSSWKYIYFFRRTAAWWFRSFRRVMIYQLQKIALVPVMRANTRTNCFCIKRLDYTYFCAYIYIYYFKSI